MIYNIVFVILFIIGLYTVLVKKSMIKMVIGLNIMEAAIFFWVISLSNTGKLIPIFQKYMEKKAVNDPIPQALILTGIVIGASTTAFLLTLIIELKKLGGSINLDNIKGLSE